MFVMDWWLLDIITKEFAIHLVFVLSNKQKIKEVEPAES